MITLTSGDIFESNTDALVNPVNCVGVMGAGLALEFKKKFPENYRTYKATCDAGLMKPGLMCFHDYGILSTPRYIINFPTKDHWKEQSKSWYIESGLAALYLYVKDHGIESIAIPALGCGLGGLDWNKVKSLIEQTFTDLENVNVLVYEPKE